MTHDDDPGEWAFRDDCPSCGERHEQGADCPRPVCDGCGCELPCGCDADDDEEEAL